LVEVLKNHVVHNLWMNMPWLYADEVVHNFHANYTVDGLVRRMRELHPYLVELEAIATRRKIPVRAAFQGTQIGSFTVLAPSRERYISLIPDLDKTPTAYAQDAAKSLGGILTDALKAAAKWVKETWQGETLADDLETSASNETSLIQWANIEGKAILLTADVGPKGLAEAADYAAAAGVLVPPNFVQVPHHGSRHNVSKTALNRWLGQPVANDTVKRGTAFCSVGEGNGAEKYPRNVVSNAFLRRGYPVHVTKGTGKPHRRPSRSARTWRAEVYVRRIYDSGAVLSCRHRGGTRICARSNSCLLEQSRPAACNRNGCNGCLAGSTIRRGA
jgi:hypothetical protein